MIFQFLVALERCFEMQEGQSVYIERFGDVSVIGGEEAMQIESKYYKRDLFDLDENVWNTISNWIDTMVAGAQNQPPAMSEWQRFNLAVEIIKHFEGWHTVRNYPYVGWGHQLQPG